MNNGKKSTRCKFCNHKLTTDMEQEVLTQAKLNQDNKMVLQAIDRKLKSLEITTKMAEMVKPKESNTFKVEIEGSEE